MADKISELTAASTPLAGTELAWVEQSGNPRKVAVSDIANAGSGFVDVSGTPIALDYARFTDADTIEGRDYSEVRTDLGLVIGTNVQAWSAVLDATTASFLIADESKLDAITGTNTGDQTSIVGITGNLTEFNTALTGADFATGGGTATGSNTGDITLAGTPDYITISGQVITRNAIVATTDLSATGTKNSTTFLRGDDTWAVPGGGGTVTSVSAGDGMDFTTITGSGPVTLGTPSSTTNTSTNQSSATTHSHLLASAAVTLAKMASVATDTVFYRKTAGTGAPEVQTLPTLKTDLDLSSTNTGDQVISLEGDVSGSGSAGFTATIEPNAVTYDKMQKAVADNILLGNVSGAISQIAEITAAQVTAMLDQFTDTLPGVVPASGGGTVNFLRADGTWANSSPGTVMSFFLVDDDGTTGQTTTGTASALVNLWSTPTYNTDSDFTFTDSTGVLVVNTDGMLDLSVTVASWSNVTSSHHGLRMRVQKQDLGAGGWNNLVDASSYGSPNTSIDEGQVNLVNYLDDATATDEYRVLVWDSGADAEIGAANVAGQTFISCRLFKDQVTPPTSVSGTVAITLEDDTSNATGTHGTGSSPDYFVEAGAAGGGDGTTGSPWNSIASANTVPAGSIVELREGTGDTFTDDPIYPQNDNVRFEVKTADTINLTGGGSGGASLDYAIDFSYGTGVTGCTVDGITAHGSLTAGQDAWNNSHLDRAFNFTNATNCLIENCTFKDTRDWNGSIWTNSTDCTLDSSIWDTHGNHFDDSNGDGEQGNAIPLYADCTRAKITNCTLSRSGHEFIFVGCNGCIIRGNTFDMDWRGKYGVGSGQKYYARAIALGTDLEGNKLAKKVLIEDNEILRSGGNTDTTHTFAAKINGDRVIFRNNLMKDNPTEHFITGSHRNPANDQLKHVFVYNNTFYIGGRGFAELNSLNTPTDPWEGPYHLVNNVGQDFRNQSESDSRDSNELATRGNNASDVLANDLKFAGNITDTGADVYITGASGGAQQTLTSMESSESGSFHDNVQANVISEFPDDTGETIANFIIGTGRDDGVPHATVAVADTGSGTTLIVDYARVFWDGGGFPGETGDQIRIGGTLATIASIDSDTQITLVSGVSRIDGDDVIWAEAYTGAGTNVLMGVVT